MSEHKPTETADKFTPTDRSRVRRKPDRAHYERQTVYDILDQAFVCHVAFVADGLPFVVPTNYVRVGDKLYLHGSPASRLMKVLSSGAPFTLAVTLLDGIVFSPTAMGHSVNYRSVVVIGKAEIIQDPDAKMNAMRDFVEYVARGRWAAVRPPTAQEVAATTILAVPLVEASAKMRTGFAVDGDAEYASGAWAGVLPFKWTPGEPIRDPRGNPSVPVPANIQHYSRPQ
jgi:nitroimidazol reductase NimA-like FMN-containing flavoprotein (pyridoxamine 5'-phosphate oxidase superfamily)